MTSPLVIGLSAVVVAIKDGEAVALTVRQRGSGGGPTGLPFGPFDPGGHRTFELALRAFVTEQTRFDLGYVEQLYTFGDKGRDAPLADLGDGDAAARVISVGYLALAPAAVDTHFAGSEWRPWSRIFPWEDWREARPPILDKTILPLLKEWADRGGAEATHALGRRERLRFTFGTGGSPWDEERVLDRYELLYEAGLIEEARRDGREAALARKGLPALGEPMRFDHRRILATAIARLRAKLKYRPVVFELMPREFTLTELQRTVEAISGRRLHKQNFRRLVENAALVEATGEMSTATGGRPAALFRFRRDVLAERPAAGLRLGGRG